MKTVTAEPIDVETAKSDDSKALIVHQRNGEVGQALSASQITERLRFIRQVMQDNMTVGVDYGKVPGCGDKPGLFQPGAQKLSMTFQLNPEVREETITDYQGFHRGYRFVVRVSNGSKFAEGVGECSTLESKYRYRAGGRKCPKCGGPHIIKGKAEYGGGWICFSKKGGCGEKFADRSELGQQIAAQGESKVEHDNPPDHWNTVQKMAFKRAFVHAIINATNTSELWSQDLEDLASNGVGRGDDDDKNNSGASGRNAMASHQPSPPVETTAAARTVEPVKPPKCATAVTRQYLLDTFAANTGQVNHPKLLEYCSKAGMLTGTQTVEELSLCYVPVDKRQMDLWTAAFNGFVEGDPPSIPFKNPEPPPKPNGAEVPRDNGVGTWKDYPVPFGKNAGKKLSQLDRNQLAAYARMMDEECEFETYEDKKTGQTRKKSATSMATNRRFKEMLDLYRAEVCQQKGVESEAA